jgi:hypothetical protein
MARKKKLKCVIDTCTDTATCSGFCWACYQGVRYWTMGKTPRQLLKRKQQLDRLEARMQFLMPNVSTLRGVKPVKRRKAA